MEDFKKIISNGILTEFTVNSEGIVKDSKGLVRKWYDNGHGYKVVSVRELASTRMRYVHRLVAQAFLPNPDNLPQVNHIDCDKENNCVDNLEWISASENIRHAHSEGRMKKRSEMVTRTPLTREEVIDLYTSVKRGVGITEKAKQMGIARTTASSVMNKRCHKQLTDMLDRLAIWNLRNDPLVELGGW